MKIELNLDKNQLKDLLFDLERSIDGKIVQLTSVLNDELEKLSNVEFHIKDHEVQLMSPNVAWVQLLIDQLNRLVEEHDLQLNTKDWKLRLIGHNQERIPEDIENMVQKLNNLLRMSNNVPEIDDNFDGKLRIKHDESKYSDGGARSKIPLIKELRDQVPGISLKSAKTIIEHHLKQCDDDETSQKEPVNIPVEETEEETVRESWEYEDESDELMLKCNILSARSGPTTGLGVDIFINTTNDKLIYSPGISTDLEDLVIDINTLADNLDMGISPQMFEDAVESKDTPTEPTSEPSNHTSEGSLVNTTRIMLNKKIGDLNVRLSSVVAPELGFSNFTNNLTCSPDSILQVEDLVHEINLLANGLKVKLARSDVGKIYYQEK